MLFCWDFFFSGKEGHVCLVQPVCRSRPTIKPWCSWQDIGRHDRRTVLIELWFVLFPWIRHQNLWSLYASHDSVNHSIIIRTWCALILTDLLFSPVCKYFHSKHSKSVDLKCSIVWHASNCGLHFSFGVHNMQETSLLCTVTEFMWLDCQIQFTWLFTILVVKKMVLLVVQGKKIISKNLFVFHMSYWL